jgi:hypothetical protein
MILWGIVTVLVIGSCFGHVEAAIIAGSSVAGLFSTIHAPKELKRPEGLLLSDCVRTNKRNFRGSVDFRWKTM